MGNGAGTDGLSTDREEILVETYTDFAQVYDTFMDNIPYEEWAEYIKEILRRQNVADGLVLDLGCGTGTLT